MAEPAKEQPGWRRLLASSNAALLPLCLEPCLILLVWLLPNRGRAPESIGLYPFDIALICLVAGSLLMILSYGVIACNFCREDSQSGAKASKTKVWGGALLAGLGCGLLASAAILEPRCWISAIGFLLMLGVYAAVDRSTPSDSLLRDLIKPLVMVPLLMGLFGQNLSKHVLFFLLAFRAISGALAIRGALNRTSDAMICGFLSVGMVPLIYIAVQEKVFGTPQNSIVFACLWVVILAFLPVWKRGPWLLELAETGVVFYILKDWDYWMNVFTKMG